MKEPSREDLLVLMKFTSISFVMDEYFEYSMETLLKMHGTNFLNTYKSRNGASYNQLNRGERNIFDRAFRIEMDSYSKKLMKWKDMTRALRVKFEDSKDKDHNKVAHFSINLLHRALDKFEISADNDILVDKVKDHIFDSLDDIKTKHRPDDEALRLKSSFDNWLVINKLK